MVGALSSCPTVVVEGGVHRAARVSLETGCSRLGPGSECDIVITDLEPAGSFTIDVVGDAIRIGSCKQTLNFDKVGDLRPGRSRLGGNGTRFSSGGIAFRIETAGAEQPIARMRSVRSTSAVAVAALCVIGAAAFVTPTASERPAAASSFAQATDIGLAGSADKGRSSIVSRSRSAKLLQDFHQHLASKGLDSVVLTANTEGAIEASGQIPTQQGDVWREASRWFDGLGGGPLVLVDRVTMTAEAAPLTVRAVWPGHLPYVVDGSGDKLFVGSVLPTGWTISGIDAKRVQMKRGDQVLAVRF